MSDEHEPFATQRSAEELVRAAKRMNAQTTRILLTYPDGSTAKVVITLCPPKKKSGG